MKMACFNFKIVVLMLACCQIAPSDSAITIALNSTGKWPGGKIPFRLDESITDYTKITNLLIGMQHIEEFTGGCIQFTRHNGESDYVIFQDESYTQDQTCFSYTGRTGNWQPVRLSTDCLDTPGKVVHILTRVVGLYPESNRPDRDKYISIQWDNILQEKLQEYAIIPESYQMHVFYAAGYDFGSITHFIQSQYARSSSLKTWILQPGVTHPGIEVDGTIGQRIGLSYGDVAAIRFLYNCNYSATITPEIGCQGKSGSGGSLSREFQRGQSAGFFFCKCHQNNITGETYFYGDRCQFKRCTPTCSSLQNSVCDSTDGTADVLPKTICKCKQGYRGELCQDYYCATPCLNGGVCIGPNKCKCPLLFTGSGCKSVATCSPKCQHGGECIRRNKCRCQIGWSGRACSDPVCEHECLNQGVCVAPNICKCPFGYTGLRCENSNVTFGLPCTNNYDCTHGWGDNATYCNLQSPCPGVNRTCVCLPGYERLPTGGRCRFQRHLGERCSWVHDVCIRNGECIEGYCACNKLKGWVKGPLNDCVKATQSKTVCKYWEDCLYNRTCSSNGRCACPQGMVDDELTGKYTCRAKVWGESCSKTADCKFVGINAVCANYKNNEGRQKRGCTCSKGIPYEFLVDQYHVGKTCVPPFPQKWGERCSIDFSKQPLYGPCERNLICQLCPRTTNEYRCQTFEQKPLVGFASKLLKEPERTVLFCVVFMLLSFLN